MGFIKRAITTIYRQPIKSCIFLALIFLLGILTSGAISVREAIFNTETNLRRQMPAIAMVEYDFDHETAMEIYDETGVWPDLGFELLTSDMIHEIGALPQVQIFDYSIDIHFGVTGTGLTLWQDIDWYSPYPMGYDQDLGVEFTVEGISTTYFLEARTGFLELIEGRSFNETDLSYNKEYFPVLISSAFAEVNGFGLDSLFDVQVVVFNHVEQNDGSYMEDRNGSLVAYEEFTLEVIGVFEPILPQLSLSADDSQIDNARFRTSQINHRLYVPNSLAQLVVDVMSEASWRDGDILLQNFFLLNDPLVFEDFANGVGNLDGNWRAVDFSRGFSEISSSMENLLAIADLILFIAIGATVLVTGLLVLLFLRDRRHEIGIYLALGEAKSKIVLQIFLELIPLAIVAMTLALFMGNIMASEISMNMLRRELALPSDTSGVQESHLLKELGYHFELTHEEMLDAYEIRLDTQSVVLFYTIGGTTIFLATLTPIMHAINLNPKQLLLESQT